MMKKIEVRIEWSGKNYGCIADNPALVGIIVVTNKTLAGLKNDFRESLQFHIEGCIKSGDILPDWLLSGEYELDYILEISALLHSLDGIITRSAIARVSGINERQIGYYASGIRVPRPEQRRRIIDGIHQITRELLAIV
jgi:hypothetical protein